MKKLFIASILILGIIPASLSAENFRTVNEKKIASLNKKLEKDGQNIDLYYDRAICNLYLNNIEEALKDADAIYSIQNNDYHVFLIRGFAFHQTEKYDSAILEYDRIIEKSPDIMIAYVNKGQALRALRKYEEAIQMFDMAISLDPEFVYSYTNKANCLLEKGEKKEAIKLLETTIELYPENYFLITKLVWYYSVSHENSFYNPQRALELAVKLTHLSNRSAEMYDSIAAAYACNDFFKEAVFYQKLAIKEAADEDISFDYFNAMKKRLELYKSKKPYRE